MSFDDDTASTALPRTGTGAAAAPRRYADLSGPRGLPWLGSALQVEPGRFHLQIEDWCREYGPFFKLELGGRSLLVVGDREAVAAVLRDRPEGFRRTSRLALDGAGRAADASALSQLGGSRRAVLNRTGPT